MRWRWWWLLIHGNGEQGEKVKEEKGQKRKLKEEDHALVIKKAQSSSMYLCMLWSGFMCCVRAFVCVCVPLLTCTPNY